MAEKQQAALFPDPPPFYQHFTAENLERLQQLRQARNPDNIGDIQNNELVENLPNELRYLLPPPPPDDTWRTFGVEHSLSVPDPSLAESGVEQLYPDHPAVKLAPQEHLIALARSLLTTFLSLCGILSQNPGLYEEKVQDLRTMAINMHALINEYRPHQTRESLILLIEQRIDTLRGEIASISELEQKVTNSTVQIQDQIKTDLPMGPKREVDSIVAERSFESQRAAWSMLDKLGEGVKHASNDTQSDTAFE